MQRRVFIFLQKSKIQTPGNIKKNFFSYFISEIPNFFWISVLSENAQRQSIPLKSQY